MLNYDWYKVNLDESLVCGIVIPEAASLVVLSSCSCSDDVWVLKGSDHPLRLGVPIT